MVEGSGFENRRSGNGSMSSNLISSAEFIEEFVEGRVRAVEGVTKSVTKTDPPSGVRTPAEAVIFVT